MKSNDSYNSSNQADVQWINHPCRALWMWQGTVTYHVSSTKYQQKALKQPQHVFYAHYNLMKLCLNA